MNKRRREFIKGITCATVGIGCGFPFLRAVASDKGKVHSSGRQLGMVIDIEKCLNEEVRKACIRACKQAHNLPDPADPQRKAEWIWAEKYKTAFPDRAHASFSQELNSQPVLMLCNHCSEPACTKVCPTGATWKRDQDGVVMMDMHRCIGCRYCMAACPYGARSFNWFGPRPGLKKTNPEYPTRTKGVVEKCTFCAERIRRGLEPACVEASKAVPGGKGALTFGDLSDPKSEIAGLLREKRTINRKIALGTGPNVFYII